MSIKNSRGNAVGPAAGRGRGRGGRGGQTSRGGRGQGRRADDSSRRDDVNACNNNVIQSRGERQSEGVRDGNQYGNVTKNLGIDEEPISQPTSQTASIPVNAVPDGGSESHPVKRPPESPGSSSQVPRSSSVLPLTSPRGNDNNKANAQANRGRGTDVGPPGSRQGRVLARGNPDSRREPSTPNKRHREDEENGTGSVKRMRSDTPNKRHREDEDNGTGSGKRMRSDHTYRDDGACGSERRISRTKNGDNDEIIKEMRTLYRRMCTDNQQLNQTLCNENRLLKDAVKRLEVSVETLRRETRDGNLIGAGKAQRGANANSSTPKRLYEETMCCRLEGLEDVFSSPNLQAAC